MNTQDLKTLLDTAVAGNKICTIEQTYIIDSTVNVPAGVTLQSLTGKGILQASADMTILNPQGHGVAIKGIKFIAPSNNSQAIFNADNADNITVDGCTSNCPLFNSQGNLTDFTISNNTLKGSDKGVGNAGILIAWDSIGKIFGNVIDTFTNGIQWWGGDSAPDHNTASKTTDVHGTSKIEIYENVISNVSQGGIFGSMGSSIHTYNNQVSLCDDVGIDYEGTINSIIENNTVTDCNNGNYSEFFYNTGNVFRNNRSILTGNKGNKHFAIYNGAPNSDPNLNLDVTLNSNVWDGPGQIGQDYVKKIISDGKNVFLRGAFQQWTAGDSPTVETGTVDIPIAGYQKKVVTPVTPVAPQPVVDPVAESKLIADEAQQKADEAAQAAQAAKIAADEAVIALINKRLSDIEAKYSALITLLHSTK